jgi:hypothetical protein
MKKFDIHKFLIGHRAPVSRSQRGKTNESGRKRRRGRERRGEGWKRRRRSRRPDSHRGAFPFRPSSLKVSLSIQILSRYRTALLIWIPLGQ